LSQSHTILKQSKLPWNIQQQTSNKTMTSAEIKKNTAVPWVELYRPKNLDEVAHQEDVVNTLKSTLKTGQMPHLLLVRLLCLALEGVCFVPFIVISVTIYF